MCVCVCVCVLVYPPAAELRLLFLSTCTELQVQVENYWEDGRLTISESLKCQSSCLLPGSPSYVWYQNHMEFKDYYPNIFNPGSSYACAVQGHENFRSPPIGEFTLYSVSLTQCHLLETFV